MKCALCNKPIKKYNSQFNNLKIDETHTTDICSECIDKFLKWQRSILATLFPTKIAKKMYEKKD